MNSIGHQKSPANAETRTHDLKGRIHENCLLEYLPVCNVADLPHGYQISAEEVAPKRTVLHDESFKNSRSSIFFSSLRLALPHPHVETEGRTVLP